LREICPKIAKLVEFTLEKYISPKYSQFLFQKNKIIAYYTQFILLPTILYKVVGRYQGQEWLNKLPFKIEEGEGEVEEDQGEFELHKEKQRWCGECRSLLLFCLLATRYNALRYNKSSKKRKRKCWSSNKKPKKKEGNAAALTKAKGKCALIERSVIGLNS